MLIIDQWGKNGTEFIKSIDTKNEDGKYCLYINNQKFAESSESKIIKIQEKLYFFINRYKRFTDTFDIGAELKKM